MAVKNDFREEVANMFINSLKENPREWHRGWNISGTGKPINIATNITYNGANLFKLKYVELQNEYKDPRWATFKQIKDNKWHLQRGSKGVRIEYWLPVNAEEGRAITWREYGNLPKDEKEAIFVDASGKKRQKYTIRAKYYTVFNASSIDGVPEFTYAPKYNDIKPSEVVNKISQGMNVEVFHDGGNKAYYSPSLDSVHLPKKELFKSDYEYQSTALHELGHATGHAARLNRNQSGIFGSPSYAYEELIAEITSSLMGEYIKAPITEENMNNHIAYVQSWISEIENDRNYLFKAIKEAEKASDYMIEKGELDLQQSVEKISYEVISYEANLKGELILGMKAGDIIKASMKEDKIASFDSLEEAKNYLNDNCETVINEKDGKYDCKECAIVEKQFDIEGEELCSDILDVSTLPVEFDSERKVSTEVSKDEVIVTFSNERYEVKLTEAYEGSILCSSLIHRLEEQMPKPLYLTLSDEECKKIAEEVNTYEAIEMIGSTFENVFKKISWDSFFDKSDIRKKDLGEEL